MMYQVKVAFQRQVLRAVIVILGLCGLSLGLTGCLEKVPAGNVGVMVDLYGSSKGVQAQELGVGRYWVGFNQELFLFPTFTQTYTWANYKEGDESITFQSLEGLAVNTDVGVTYHVTPDKVSVLFQKYRRTLSEITDTYIHNMVRDAFVEKASQLPIETIYGKGKSALVESVQATVQDQVSPIGIVIEKIYLVGTLRLPEAVGNAINAKAAASQMAEQRQNELAQSQAEAQKEIAAAQGVAQSKLIVADAEAKAIKLKGDALKDNPALIQWSAVDKWDGKMPQVSGGATPFISLGSK
jgi:regulator of protease activity HflC (stomatin/prohibitin superfamily)